MNYLLLSKSILLSSCYFFYYIIIWTLGDDDEVSMLTHTYPHKPLRKIKGHVQSPSWQSTLCDLVICKLKECDVVFDVKISLLRPHHQTRLNSNSTIISNFALFVAAPRVTSVTLESAQVEWPAIKPMGTDTITYLLQMAQKDHDYKKVGLFLRFKVQNIFSDHRGSTNDYILGKGGGNGRD